MIKKIQEFYQKLSFRAKLSIVFSTVCVVLVIIVGIVSYRLASAELQRLSTQLSENNISSAEQALSQYFDTTQKAITEVVRLDNIQSLTKANHSVSAEDKSALSLSINEIVRAAALENVSITALDIFMEDFSSSYLSNYHLPFDDYQDCLDFLAANGIDIDNHYTPGQWVIAPYFDQQTRREHQSLTLVRFIYNSSSMEKKGVILAAVDTSHLYNAYGGYANGSFIVGTNQLIYSAASSSSVGQVLEDQNLLSRIQEVTNKVTTFSYVDENGKEVMYSVHSILQNSAYLITPFDYYTGISQQERTRYITSFCILLAFSAASALALSLIFSRRLSHSLNVLNGFVKRIDAGQLELRCPVEGKDEFAYLSTKINDMLDSIAASMRLREKEIDANRLMEIKLMQSQINPHLFYNTLDSVLWFLQSNQTQDATELIYALSSFFKLSLSHGKSMIPLKSELELIQHYLSIQHIARQQDISLITDITPDLLDKPVCKFLLQPIVENAVIHGFSGYRDDGEISIRTETHPDYLKIIIRDNGLGLLTEDIKAIEAMLPIYPPPENIRNFGLYNINWRIKHTYGKQYGVSICSSVSEFTEVTLTFPPDVNPLETVQ